MLGLIFFDMLSTLPIQLSHSWDSWQCQLMWQRDLTDQTRVANQHAQRRHPTFLTADFIQCFRIISFQRTLAGPGWLYINQTDRQTDRQTDTQTETKKKEQRNRQMDRQMGRKRAEKQTNGQTDGQKKSRETVRRTDRQRGRQVHRQRH